MCLLRMHILVIKHNSLGGSARVSVPTSEPQIQWDEGKLQVLVRRVQ